MQTATALDRPSEFERTTIEYLAAHLTINLDEFCGEHFAKDLAALTHDEARQLYWRLRAMDRAAKPIACLECGTLSYSKKCDYCREGIGESQLNAMVRYGSNHIMARGAKPVIEQPRRQPQALRFRLNKGNERP